MNIDDVLDHLLDTPNLEVDPPSLRTGDTPLHLAVKFACTHNPSQNKDSPGEEQYRLGTACVELLVDAGADARCRNKGKARPVDVCDPRRTELREVLVKAEYAAGVEGDVVHEDDVGGDEGSESD